MKIFVFALISLILLSGCIQDNGSEGVALPQSEVDATIISLSLTNVDEDPNDLMLPRDKAVIRIDNIYSSDTLDLSDILDLSVGDEVTVEFDYSARPVILRMVPSGETPSGNEDEDQGVSVSMDFLIEDGFFVYLSTSGTYTEVTEESLPGLEKGSKFKAIIWLRSSNEFSINKYELK